MVGAPPAKAAGVVGMFGGLRESPPAAAATRRPGRVALISFDGPSGALNRSSERRFNCGQPSMHFFRLPSIAAATACRSGSGREPLRRDFGRDTRSAGLLLTRSPAIRKWQGWTRPPPSQCLATTVGLCARLLPVVREGIRRFAEAACRLGYAPAAAESATWRTVPFCGASPRSPRYSRGLARRTRQPAPGAGFPRQTPDCSRRVRLPGLPGIPRFTAVALRSTPNCFDAPRTPWTSGVAPGEAVIRRHQSAAHYTGIISGSPAKLAGTRPPPQGSRRLPRPVTTGFTPCSSRLREGGKTFCDSRGSDGARRIAMSSSEPLTYNDAPGAAGRIRKPPQGTGHALRMCSHRLHRPRHGRRRVRQA